MQLTREQFELIAALLPRQRGNVRLDNLAVVNAILYVAANGLPSGVRCRATTAAGTASTRA